MIGGQSGNPAGGRNRTDTAAVALRQALAWTGTGVGLNPAAFECPDNVGRSNLRFCAQATGNPNGLH